MTAETCVKWMRLFNILGFNNEYSKYVLGIGVIVFAHYFSWPKISIFILATGLWSFGVSHFTRWFAFKYHPLAYLMKIQEMVDSHKGEPDPPHVPEMEPAVFHVDEDESAESI